MNYLQKGWIWLPKQSRNMVFKNSIDSICFTRVSLYYEYPPPTLCSVAVGYPLVILVHILCGAFGSRPNFKKRINAHR